MRFRSFAILTILIAALMLFSACDISLSPDDSGAYDRGLAALAEEDYDTALAEFEDAVTVDGRAAEGYRGQGIVYNARGDYKYAVNLFDMALDAMAVENEEFTEDVKFYKAESLKLSLQTDRAIWLYEELTESSRPNLANALLGQIYVEQGDIETAKQYFDAAVENCRDYSIYLTIYDTFKDAHLEADGTAYLEKALDITPESASDQMNLGKIYYYLEDNNKAIEWLTKAVDGGSADAVPLLGRIYMDDNNISSAKELYQESLIKGANPAACYNGLALCSLEENNPNAALSYIEEGLKYEDHTIMKSLLFNEVIAYEQLRDFDTAEQKAKDFLIKYKDDEAMKREYKFLTNG